MNSLPKEAERPKAIKASATDIPVLYLNLTLKNDRPYEEADEQQFLNLCELAENVVKRRIEQLPEVAMADITGVPGRMLQIVPDVEKLAITGITIADIENALAANNVEPGSMLVRDGYYEYNIRIATLLRTPEDVAELDLEAMEFAKTSQELCEKMAAASGSSATITLSTAKPGFWYGVAVADNLAALETASVADAARATENGVALTVPKPAGGTAFFKVLVNTQEIPVR